jgi:hypothetical protein
MEFGDWSLGIVFGNESNGVGKCICTMLEMVTYGVMDRTRNRNSPQESS